MRWIAQILLASIPLCIVATAETIRVGAAVSLRDALTDIAREYEFESGQKVELTFGSSGQIQAQISNGAEIDVFISAATKQVDELIREGLVVEGSRRVVAGNSVVLIVPADAKDPPASFEALAGDRVQRLAIGEPKTVPAGQYAMQVLTNLGLAETLARKIVYGANVRQVLSYVERGEASAGVVYSTDAKESGERVRVMATAKPDAHEPVVYPAIILKSSAKQDASRRFLDYLNKDAARAIFTRRGFSIPEPNADRKLPG
jgi:molybdate transport system substrate-binding protein